MQLKVEDMTNLAKFVQGLEALFRSYEYSFGDRIDVWDDGELLGYVEYEHGTRTMVFDPA